MGIKIDRFTWGIILGVLLLMAGAVIMVAATGGRDWQTDDYLNEDTPQAVVHDAFLAFVRNDPDVAVSHYSQRVRDGEGKNDPLAERFNYYDPSRRTRRLRILEVDISDDRAFVTLAIDRFNPGGLFDSGISTYRRTVPLVREDGAWKIDTAEVFY